MKWAHNTLYETEQKAPNIMESLRLHKLAGKVGVLICPTLPVSQSILTLSNVHP